MTLIDNYKKTMKDSLSNALRAADKIDICVGYFFLSGFEALSEELSMKRIRVLVGMEIDPECISDIVMYSKEDDVDLTKWQPRRPTKSAIQIKSNYVDALVGLINDSDTFDTDESSNIFDLFISKIIDGTLEIRKTKEDFHGKFYILHNSDEYSHNGDLPGTVFSGSSNFTYSGLVGQGELNEVSHEKMKYLEYVEEFNQHWNDSKSISIVDSSTGTKFVDDLKTKIWKYQMPSPYLIYLRVIFEIFNTKIERNILTPSSITNGDYSDLEYQIDAVKMGIDRINRYDGVIIADVVGLGKSIIASTIARNLDYNAVIICPPHLIEQWEDYKEQFGIRGSTVFSSGNMKIVFNRYRNSKEPILLIIDEAHRFRNEDTNDYKMLHQICRSHSENKTMLLTATPFNNAPKDIFALVKLFQTPGQSTIRSVDNLSFRFRELIERYKHLRRDINKGDDKLDIEKETNEIAIEQRRLIENIIIRRSRLDLKLITRYRNDLIKQNIDFAEVIGPELLEYDLGSLFDLYIDTLERITSNNENAYIGARYKPTMYGLDKVAFKQKYGNIINEAELKQGQRNLADFMRKLLVMRFESSKYAFKLTLRKLIDTNILVEKYWDTIGAVPIMKKGVIPDPSTLDIEDGGDFNIDEFLSDFSDERKLLLIPKYMLIEGDQFISDVKKDRTILEDIYKKWFENDYELSKFDPKFEGLLSKIRDSLKENKNRKIVIFSTYADTIDYLFDRFHEIGFSRVLKYTAAESGRARIIVKENFDASFSVEKQKNDYDILVATDALSEGFNLHRAGAIINYDIPYNPTRVIQRVGRINRINKRVFNELFVYNFFPTAVGEFETKIKRISTLKMNLINSIIGSDTKHLTTNEQLMTFFKSEFDQSQNENDVASWDTIHRENLEQALKNPDLMEKVRNIPRRSRIARNNKGLEKVVVFGKKGDESIFAVAQKNTEPEIISAEEAIPFFFSKSDEVSYSVSQDFNSIFIKTRDKLFQKNPLPTVKGRRADAIKIISAIKSTTQESEAYCIDLIRIIKEYDDVSEGTLKDIIDLNLSNISTIFESLKEIVPEHFVKSVIDRVEKFSSVKETLLLAEEI